MEAKASGELRPAPESLLGVDFGTAFTKVALFEPVEGQYRLVARAQTRTDLSAHVYETLGRACHQIETLTGRQLFANGEPLAGDVAGSRGVEVLGASIGCHPQLRVMATNAEAADAARGQFCRVDLLKSGPVSDKISQLAGGVWDAITGEPAEVEHARQWLGHGSDPNDQSGPVLITGDVEQIRNGLAALILKLASSRVPGLPELAASATEPLITGESGLLELTRLIATRFGLRLGIVDCGASRTILCHASPNESGARVTAHERSVMDLPTSQQRMDRLRQFLETALIKSAEDGFTADLLVATGALAHLSRWHDAALTLLNGVRPAGVIQFAIDNAGIISQLAAFASSYPDVACHIFEQDGLLSLGAAICPRGEEKPGTKAIEVRWQVNDDAEHVREVNYGDLVLLPLPPAHKASLALYPTRHIDVGLNRPGVAAKAHVDGGRVGLMVDVRKPSEKNQRTSWSSALE